MFEILLLFDYSVALVKTTQLAKQVLALEEGHLAVCSRETVYEAPMESHSVER